MFASGKGREPAARSSRRCSYPTNNRRIETLGPVGLGKLRHGRGLRSGIHRDQRAFLPLEQISGSQNVLPCRIELHRSLYALVRFARVEFSDEFRVINAVDIVCCLLEYLPDRESLWHIGADAIGSTTVLRQVVTDHLSIVRSVDRG